MLTCVRARVVVWCSVVVACAFGLMLLNPQGCHGHVARVTLDVMRAKFHDNIPVHATVASPKWVSLRFGCMVGWLVACSTI